MTPEFAAALLRRKQGSGGNVSDGLLITERAERTAEKLVNDVARDLRADKRRMHKAHVAMRESLYRSKGRFTGWTGKQPPKRSGIPASTKPGSYSRARRTRSHLPVRAPQFGSR
jgi:hypothetical protein